MRSLNSRKETDGLWRSHFLLLEDSNPPSVCLTTPQFKTNWMRGHTGRHRCIFYWHKRGLWAWQWQCHQSETNNDTYAVLCAALRQAYDRAPRPVKSSCMNMFVICRNATVLLLWWSIGCITWNSVAISLASHCAKITWPFVGCLWVACITNLYL